MRELSLHILDLLENAVEAGASKIEIKIEEDLKTDWMVIEIMDNGRGMSQELIERVLDPFCTTRTTRHVGLGLPLFLEAARRCGGDLVIQSNPGKGTRVRATFATATSIELPWGTSPGHSWRFFSLNIRSISTTATPSIRECSDSIRRDSEGTRKCSSQPTKGAGLALLCLARRRGNPC